MKRRPLIPALLIALLLLPTLALADVKATIKKLAPSGMVLVLDQDGKELVAQNTGRPFTPASTTKIVTAWLAMEVLGGDYRFKTQFYMDQNRVLYVRGGGDPFLVSEELALLAPKLLAKTGKKPFTGLVLDAGYYPDELRIPGIEHTDEAYDALNTALSVNFNTIHARRKGKKVTSAEKQTPITPLAISQFRARGPKGRARISLAQEDPSISVLYAGELIAAFIKKAGGSVDGKISIGSVPAGLKPAYVHSQSRPLSEILRLMLLGSNNFIANQVFLEVGAHEASGQVSLKKSLDVTQSILKDHKLEKDIQLTEGSGISRDNRFTAHGLATILHHFASHAKQMRQARSGSRFKTGTLSDVKTLAGFAETKKHGTVRFVIALGGGSGKLRYRLLKAIETGL
ncbi:MAG: D-alanyl-D-alanine carboxypeptidase [Stappiaceae bacterium]